MNSQRDIDLVDELVTASSESPWLEFKKDNFDPDTIGVRSSALANAARLAGKDRAFMLWGVEDETLSIVGTRLNPDSQKAHGQELAFWLARQLQHQMSASGPAIIMPSSGF